MRKIDISQLLQTGLINRAVYDFAIECLKKQHGRHVDDASVYDAVQAIRMASYKALIDSGDGRKHFDAVMALLQAEYLYTNQSADGRIPQIAIRMDGTEEAMTIVYEVGDDDGTGGIMLLDYNDRFEP